MRREKHCFLLGLVILLFSGCRLPAVPKEISTRPSSINGIPIADQPFPPTKPIELMTWQIFEPETNRDLEIQKLKDFQGKVLILDFWATYCPPCLEEIPHLKNLQQRYGSENLQIIGLHVGGNEDRSRVPGFHKRLQITYPLATPEEELVRFIFGAVSEIPQTAIFDRKGRLVRKFVGFNEQIKAEMDATLEKVINSGP
jgi:thiol-disulfide isomerase/thioredoxin